MEEVLETAESLLAARRVALLCAEIKSPRDYYSGVEGESDLTPRTPEPERELEVAVGYLLLSSVSASPLISMQRGTTHHPTETYQATFSSEVRVQGT